MGEQTELCSNCRKTQPVPPSVAASNPSRLGYLQLGKVFPITSGIIAINIAIYLLMSVASLASHRGSPVNFDLNELLHWGADYGPLTLDHQFWRLITSMWLHGGIIHIAGNMWCLWSLGLLTERLYGRQRMISVYLLTGIASSLTSMLIHPFTVSVGASGAIFGVVGALVYPLYRRRKAMPGPAINATFKSIGQFIVINLMIGFSLPFIDNSAHIGGLLMGVVLGFVWTHLAADPAEVPSLNLKVTAAGLLFCAAAYFGIQRFHLPTILPVEAELALEQGRKDTALAKAKQALEVAPNEAGPHEAMGDVLFSNKQYAEASDEFSTAFRLAPDDTDIPAKLGASLTAQNKWAEAVGPLRRATLAKPDDAEAWLNLGIAVAAQNQANEGLEYVRKSLNLDPRSARAQYVYGLMLQAKGDAKGALAALREAVQLNPNDPAYRDALARAEPK
jgi:membrane associated rhomboid family serine protease/Tfp pilus assembly protein PilF